MKKTMRWGVTEYTAVYSNEKESLAIRNKFDYLVGNTYITVWKGQSM